MACLFHSPLPTLCSERGGVICGHIVWFNTHECPQIDYIMVCLRLKPKLGNTSLTDFSEKSDQRSMHLVLDALTSKATQTRTSISSRHSEDCKVLKGTLEAEVS